MFQPLEKAIRYLPRKKIAQVRKAYEFGAQAHAKQVRSSGEPYITHPVAVAGILAQMKFDAESLMAAMLHDVIEDTKISKEEVAQKFGEEVAELVDGVSKLTNIEFANKAEAQAANFTKMLLAMTKDLRVILIKLADRLHNMRTLEHRSPEKRRHTAKETLEIFAPIANRLGMRNFRDEFQEIGFQMLYPLRYRAIKKAVQQTRGHRKEILKTIQTTLAAALKKAGIKHSMIDGREKSLYGIYQKMQDKHLRLSEVMDVYGFRIVVPKVEDCYRVLGVVHHLYKPLPERFKDYIAMPKGNGYQSLHTTLFGPHGVPIEIQIRTLEMHQLAENGIAAHWLYKSESKLASEAQIHAHQWIKGVLELQQNTGDSLEFVENVKIDLFPDEVYVFTPQGRILELPVGATAVDFAYAVHSDLGNTCVTVKIDQRLAPLSTPLKSGQTIEIVTAPGARPNPAWLNFVVTGKARSNIRHFLKEQNEKEAFALGLQLLETELKDRGQILQDISEEEKLSVAKQSGFPSFAVLLENIGLGNQALSVVMEQLLGQPAQEARGESSAALMIKGAEGLALHFAKCCYPIPGDPIVGIMTPGKGMILHTEACQELHHLKPLPEKYVAVRWEEPIHGEFEVPVHVEILNERGALANLAGAISWAEGNINDIQVEDRSGQCVKLTMFLSVKSRTHLSKIMKKIHALPRVTKILRYHSRELKK